MFLSFISKPFRQKVYLFLFSNIVFPAHCKINRDENAGRVQARMTVCGGAFGGLWAR